MKLIIWDFDGTLANTKPIIEAGMDYTLRVMGLDPNIKQTWLTYVGLSLEDGAHIVFDNTGINPELVIKTYKTFGHRENEHLIKGFDGIDELLAELSCLGITMAIATSKYRDSLLRQLKMLGWEKYFYPLVTPDDVQIGKPNPESIYKCLSAHNAEPKDAVMIGDTGFDLDMAQRANVASIAVGYGFQSILSMNNYKPIACVNEIFGLREAILTWSQT